MSDNGKIYVQKRYFALALDPIHVGTGGYRIGRVDNTIVRESATGIPKIPGSTIEGVCRSYAFLKARESGKLKDENYKGDTHPLACAKGKETKVNGEDKFPCGTCEICITFGYTTDTKSLQAMALFSDAYILLFPVATMIGPVWVTCSMVLKDAGLNDIRPDNVEQFVTNLDTPENLNLGWLLLERDGTKTISSQNWNLEGVPSEIINRVVVVSDDLFPQIVNSNLEVRTSVAIDPERGAAEEHALFTYEAIPKGTVFWFDVVYQNPSYFPTLSNLNKGFRSIKNTVKDGLSLFKFLGVGGMGSRGFGRLEILNF